MAGEAALPHADQGLIGPIVFKRCSTCREEKPRTSFGPRKESRDGLVSRCRACAAASSRASAAKNKEAKAAYWADYYRRNAERIKANARERRNADTAAAKAASLAWYRANKERALQNHLVWARNNRAIVSAHNANRRVREARATPAWANSFFIEEAYALAKLRESVTGGRWHVDHIVPLKSDRVCGLHTDSNLRVIPAAENIRKRNLWWPDMPDYREGAL